MSGVESRVVELIKEGKYRQQIYEAIDGELSLYKITKVAERHNLDLVSGTGSDRAMNIRRKNNLDKWGHINAGVAQTTLNNKFNKRLEELNRGRQGDYIINKENLEKIFNETNSVIDTARWFGLDRGSDTGALRRICKELGIGLEIKSELPLTKKEYIEAYKKYILRKDIMSELNISPYFMDNMEIVYGLKRDDIISKEELIRHNYIKNNPDMLTPDEIKSLIRKHITKKAFKRDEKSISFSKLERMMKHYGMDWFDAITLEEWEKHVGRSKGEAWAKDPTIYERQIEAERKNGTLRTSYFEREVRAFVGSIINSKDMVIQDRSLLGNLELDIVIPSKRIAIECNGMFWHNEDNLGKYYHITKSKETAKRGYHLIHIYEWEWKSETSRPIVESIIKSALGKIDQKIPARKCEIKELENPEYRKFLQENHLQGFRPAKVKYGLYYEGELVQLMSFGERIHTSTRDLGKHGWEIVRSGVKLNTSVVGGISKLFKHFIKEHNPSRIRTFADSNKFTGKGYEMLGMNQVGYLTPNRWFVNQNEGKVSNWLFRGKEKRDELLKNTYSVWGSGHLTYEWKKETIEEDKNEN